MDLKSYVKPLIEYWWLILAAGLVAMASTFVVTASQPLIYQSQTTLVVGNMMYEANPSGNDIYLGQQLANYYAKIGMQSEVRNSTQAALGMNWLPSYTFTPLPNSQLIEIVVNDSDPVRAQVVANELATQLIRHSPTSQQEQDSDQQDFITEQIAYLEEKITETLLEIDDAERNLSEINSAQEIAAAQDEISALQTKLSQLQTNYAALLANTEQGAINVLSVIEPAILPTSPVGPSKLMMVLIAGVAAAGIAGVAAYVIDFLDDTLKTPEDIAKVCSVPMLGSVARSNGGFWKERFGKDVQHGSLHERWMSNSGVEESDKFGDSPILPMISVPEEFRLLRMNLERAFNHQSVNTILVTSPSPKEGRSTVAYNLAIVMAQSGKKVALLDVNFRDSKDDWVVSVTESYGLSDILWGTVELDDVIQSWDWNLNFIDAGVDPPAPVDFSGSQPVAKMLDELEETSHIVIIDGPPLSSSNALALSQKVDGVLVVLRHGYTRQGTAKAQFEKLDQVGANSIGVVLNNTPA